MKDLELFPDGILYEPIFFANSLPSPMNETTTLEFCIGITQFYAFVSVSLSGFALFYYKGYRALLKLQEKKKKMMDTISKSTSLMIVRERYDKDVNDCYRHMFIGFNVLSIGVAFLWLTGNSFHITQTKWLGGISGLIHALTVMEIALVPLLYYMITDSIHLIGKAAIMEYLAQILQNCKKTIPSEIITDSVLTLLQEGDEDPFWSGNTQLFDDGEEDEDDTVLTNLAKNLESWTTGTSSSNMNFQETAAQLQTQAIVTRYEAYREILYFILNFIAFYGYFLGVLTYYTSDIDDHTSLRLLKFGMTHGDADWTGNFAGDLMWTIEPMIILTSPMMLTWLKPSSGKKTKQD